MNPTYYHVNMLPNSVWKGHLISYLFCQLFLKSIVCIYLISNLMCSISTCAKWLSLASTILTHSISLSLYYFIPHTLSIIRPRETEGIHKSELKHLSFLISWPQTSFVTFVFSSSCSS